VITATDEAELLPLFERLLAQACQTPQQWAAAMLASGWKFSVLCTANGRHALRFRALQAPALAWVDFLTEASRCTRMLGAGQWKMVESDRKAFFEVSYLSPAPEPALPPEAA